MRIIALLFILSFSALGQTPSFVPITNGSGNIGTSDKYWGTGYFNNVYYGGQTISSYVSSVKLTSFNALTGSVELVAGDGIKITTNGSQLRISFTDIPTTAIGTNRVYFRFSNITNTWTAPSGVTNIAIWAWGGAGGGAPGAGGGVGGFSYCVVAITNLSVLSIVVGGGGSYSSILFTNTIGTSSWITTTGGYPNGGWGSSWSGSRGGGGGGSSHIFYGTNLVIVAGGGAGAGVNSGGGRGGGLSGETVTGGQGGTGGTQTSGGVALGTVTPLAITNSPGSYLLGGNAGSPTNQPVSGSAGGGGGGYYGGGGALTFAGAQNVPGGGGSGYFNPSITVGGITIRSPSTSVAPASELPEYISGSGLGNATANGNAGLIVIGY